MDSRGVNAVTSVHLSKTPKSENVYYVLWQSSVNPPAARCAVDTVIHLAQEHSIAIAKLIRTHFETHAEGSLHFWEFPSKAEWFIHPEVHKEATRMHCPTEERMQTSYDMLRQNTARNAQNSGSQTLPKVKPRDGTSWLPGWMKNDQRTQKGEHGYPFSVPMRESHGQF